MHSSNAAVLQERGSPCTWKLPSSPEMGWRKKWHPASWYLQEFLLLLEHSCKEQKKYITLCWKGSPANCCYFEWHRPQKDSGNLEARENLLSTHCWHSQQPSMSRNNPSYPDNLFSQTFSHPKALLGSLQMFMTLLCHSSVMLPECLPNIWLLKKHGCL